MTIRHIGYEPNSADLVRDHYARTGEVIDKAYVENYADDTYTFYILCRVDKHIVAVTVKGAELYKYNTTGRIDSFSNNAADRELIMSNTCGECYDNLFADDEEEDEEAEYNGPATDLLNSLGIDTVNIDPGSEDDPYN